MTTLDQIQDYLYCPTRYYFLHVREDAIPFVRTTLELPGLAIKSALRLWATGEYPSMSFVQLTNEVWKTWFEHHGVEEGTSMMLADYAKARNEILDQFLSGRIRQKNRAVYKEPRLTRRYKDMMGTAALTPLAERSDGVLREKFAVESGRLSKLGVYPVADAYADALLMAGRYKPPVPATVIAIDVPVQISLLGRVIAARADMLLDGGDSTIVEVHDHIPQFYFASWRAGRDIRMIAAAHYQTAEQSLAPVKKVVYRHFMSARTIDRHMLKTSRLSVAILNATRGIEAEIYTPQFLSGRLDPCYACPAVSICLGDNEDVLEHYLPGMASWGGRVAEAAEQVDLSASPDIKQLLQVLDRHSLSIEDLTRYEKLPAASRETKLQGEKL